VTVEEIEPNTLPKKAGMNVEFASEGGTSQQLGGQNNSGVGPSKQSSSSMKAHSAQVKKLLRNAFKQGGGEDDEETEDEKTAREDKIKRAKEFMMQTACTDEENHWKSMYTPVKELGQYGVGVQLYFNFLTDIGCLFMFLFLLTIPLLVHSLGGTIIDDFPETKDQSFYYKFMSAFTPANLGTCGEDAADCLRKDDLHNRKVFAGSDGFLRDVTPALGVLDCLQMVFAMIFIIVFRVYKIPKAVRLQDEANVTASDFAVRVSGLPRKLSKNHEQYEDLLQQHFENILATECGIDKPGQVAEVTLIREYDGCISLFLQQGNLLEEMHEAGVAARLAKKAGKDKDADKHHKKRIKLKQKIEKIEASLAHQADMDDIQRDVCGAFVMFEEERQKDAICKLYKPYRGWGSRLFEPKWLHFKDWRLVVTETCEPEELYWENMDYSWFLHKMRKFATLTVSFGIVVFCIFIMTFLRSADQAVDTRTQPHDLWVFEMANSRDFGGGRGPGGPGGGDQICMELCELDVSFDKSCNPMASHPDYLKHIYSDADRHWAVGDAPHSLIDDSTSCGPNDVWRSPSCDGNSPGSENLTARILFGFHEPKAVKCLKVERRQTPGQPPVMKVYGCKSSALDETRSGNGSGLLGPDGEPFDLGTYCVRYDDVVLGDDDNNRPEPVRLRDDCLFPVTLEAAQAAKAEGEDSITSNRIRCFCSQQMAADSFFRIPGYYNNNPEKGAASQVCYDYVFSQTTQLGIRMGGVVAVMVINNILLVVFAYFDSLGRYQTATDLAASQVFNLFLATLVNTAIVYNLIGINFYTQGQDSFFGALKFGQGPYDDLSTKWFLTIGNMLVITIVCQIACSVALPVIWVLTVDPLLRWFFCKDTHSQELLNEYHVLPEWTLSLRVAETLVVVFCVFMYSSAFPVLYLFGALYCLCAFWGDKYALLRGSRKPPGYTKSAIESAVIMCPFAIIFHLLFACWMFGNQDIFPSDWGNMRSFTGGLAGVSDSQYEDIMNLVATSGFDVRAKQYGDYLYARMTDAARMAASPSLVLLMVMLIYYACCVLHWIFRPCIGNRFGKAFEYVLKALKIWQDAEDTKETLSEAKEKEEQQALLSYRMDHNPNYEEAVLALKFDPDEAQGQNGKRNSRTVAGAAVSFSAMEENLERTVVQKMHDAENFVSKAIESGLKVLSRGASRHTDAEGSLEQRAIGDRVSI